ncbi:MAG: Ig-like domain-containing protein [bacterium]
MTNRAQALAIVTLTLVSAGCAAGKNTGSCDDECGPQNTTRCAGTLVQTCLPRDSCLRWFDTMDCGQSGQSCVVTGGAPGCGTTCTDVCAAAGESRCLGAIIQTCAVSGSGCLDWVSGTDCASSGQQCDDSSAQAACTGSCADDCTAPGDTQCLGTVIQACTSGPDGCLDWVSGTDCASTGRFCDDTGGSAICSDTCVDECLGAGDTQCLGTVIQTCAVGSDSCLDWVNGNDCDSSGQQCDDSGGAATCVSTCVDECATAGDAQCQGTVIQTCTMGGDGCTDWVSGVDCASSGNICSGAGGTASCIPDCPTLPSLPSNPGPVDGANNVDWAAVTSVDWADSTNATSYDVYFGASCPPPAYPNAGFTTVTSSTLTGLTLSQATDYCWQVVAIANASCYRPGPVWTFRTTCNDPVAGPPTVTSSNVASFPAGTTGGTYSLTFSEPVNNVPTSLTWTQVVGSGTMTPTQISPQVYSIDFTGAADGDSYTLTVGSGVTDTCGNPVSPPVTITFSVDVGPGHGCGDPIDLTGAAFPVTASGTFTDDPSQGPSCDGAPTNVAWFTYTAPTSEWYDISAQNQTGTAAYSRLAIFETAACNPYGAEVECVTANSTSAEASVYLTQGTTYLIQFFTDGNGYSMVNPIIDIQASNFDPGTVCTDPADVTGGPFPVQLSGTFPEDPAQGGSCDTTPTNAVWFRFTAPTTDIYRIDAQNHSSSGAYSRLAVFQGSSCNPLGAELGCVTASSKTIFTSINMTSGQTYLILFHTDGNGYSMVNPEISVALYDPGQICTTAADISAVAFPYQQSGTFDEDPAQGGSCDTSPTNAVFFQYTPPSTGMYTIDLQNHSTSAAYSRLAIFVTTSCNPYGAQVECVTANSKTLSSTVALNAGTSYLLMFYTDGNGYTMVDPEISVTLQTYNPGEVCLEAADVSGASFPYQLGGTFDEDPSQGGSCDTSPDNAVFFQYTPSTSGSYQIDAQNHTLTAAFSRLAVFETVACQPYGPQRACVTSSGKTVGTTVSLTGGTPYLILFYTDGAAYTMVDPEITIQ